MISEQLYELAFAYKKTKLWTVLWDTQIFAVKLSDGKIGYISIMGGGGEHCALALYIGNEGFQNLFAAATVDPFSMPEYKFQEHLLHQNCLQCIFESKDNLSDEEREETKAYARANKIRLSGKNAYPHFVKHQTNCIPWHLQTEDEQKALCEALAAAIAMSNLLNGKMPHMLGLSEITENTIEIPLLEQQNGTYILEKIELPQITPDIYLEPKPENDILIQKIKKMKKKGRLECEIILFPEPVQDTPEDIPVFPVVLMAFNPEKDRLLPIMPILNYNENAETLLNSFMEALLDEHSCPLEIKVQDNRTYSFMKAFCERLHIKLTLEEELPKLIDLIYEFLETFNGNMESEPDEILEALHMLMEMDEEERKMLPPELQKEFNMLMQNPEFVDGMQELFGDTSASLAKPVLIETVASTKSYVISVSLGKGCYRHIQISCGSTLLELHTAILNAFEFFDDHAHAFFMDNKKWSDWDAYYMEGMEHDDRTTNKYRLNQVGLDVGMQFKYVFDFGDEWTFQCKVLRISDENIKAPRVIKSKGNSPEQYGPW